MMLIEKNILVAEDDPNDAFLLKRAFAREGVKVSLRFAQDGQEAVDYLTGENGFNDRQEHPLPDLLLLDLKMPKLNGFEVLQWVRRQPGLNRMLVVMLTSSGEMEDINRAYDLGANSYLVKPTNHEDLSHIAKLVRDYWIDRNKRPEYGPIPLAS